MITRSNTAPLRLRSSITPIQVADLIVITELMILLAGLLFLPLPWLRIPLGIFGVLIAPGYALTAALFPEYADLDHPARAALSVGLSIALIPPLALLLNFLPWGLQPIPIVLALTIITAGFCLAASLRRYRRGSPALLSVPPATTARLTPAQLAALGAVLLVVVWSAVVYTTILRQTTYMTEFYALGIDGRAEDYPREVSVGEPMTVMLGITNQEGAAQSYQIVIYTGETQLATVGPIALAAGASWSAPVTFSLPAAGAAQMIDIRLFNALQTEPYRHLRLGVDVRGQP